MPEGITRPLLATFAAELLVLACLFTIVLDQYAHQRVERMGGMNSWGYRGSIAPNRLGNELRIVVVGGNLAFGEGIALGDTAALYLRNSVAARLPRTGPSRWVTSFNLGALGLPAREYASRVAQFAYLLPDAICLYIDLDDPPSEPRMPPHDSVVTAFTGYVPALPLVLEQQRSRALVIAGRTIQRVDRWLYRMTRPAGPESEPRVESIGRAVHTALGIAPVVLVVPRPFSPLHQAEHARLVQLMGERAGLNPRLRFVDLAAQAQLSDPALLVDAVNYGPKGQALVASEIATALLTLLPPEGGQ